MKKGVLNLQRYSWQYRFLDLYSSSDDGKIRLQLQFRDERNGPENEIVTKVIIFFFPPFQKKPNLTITVITLSQKLLLFKFSIKHYCY